ncbi:MAG: bifunctional serine/threonine-protein kinase/formylglycine-generating enzyme family protein [Myxococcota bacterium]|nr:bifunctional serine/threonine-protein kinase/formylglycine-generating enzyme family protein [Myxococcota bacterium]
MIESEELLRRLRTRVRLPPATMAAVESALVNGRRAPEEVLQKAGLTLEQINGLLSADRLAEEKALQDASTSITTIRDEPSVDDLVARLVDITPRFELQGEIARGAMGRILAAWDLHLGRPVAIKVLKKASARDLEQIRFLEEAQVTGQLQHPNIMPVYELGRLRDQVAFVMRRIEGRSLKTVVSGLRRGKPEIRRQFSQLRLLNVFHQLCLAVAYAHSRGVVHRDLKPSNVMVGDFGEVVLLDWGLCKVIGNETRSTRSTSERWKTVHGQIIGTPAYMAPEQAGGLVSEINEQTDVYGLGAILYHLLTLRPPFVGKNNREIVARVLQEDVVPPIDRAPNRTIAPQLNNICMRCLSRNANDRYANATALAEAIRNYLDAPDTMTGHPGRQPSDASVDAMAQAGMAAIARHQSLLEDAALVADELQTARATLEPTDPADFKIAAWNAERRLGEIHTEIADVFAQAVNALMTTVIKDPEFTDAKSTLCDLYLSRHERSRLAGNQEKAAYYRRMLMEHDDGRFTAIIANEGSLYVDVEPKNADIELVRLKEEKRRFAASDIYQLGVPPVRRDPLAAGVYELRMTAPGYEQLCTTVVIDPGKCSRLRLRMLPQGLVPAGFIHIPAGTFRAGSRYDPYLPPSEQALPDYFMARYPVTAENYLQFLNDLSDDVPEEAAMRVPRTADGLTALWARDEAGHYILPTELGWTTQTPIVGISVDDAAAYCGWLSHRTGQIYRVPSELEWEKASRGSEGRVFSWGDGWDSGFAACAESWPYQLPPDVGAFETDSSPYGISDCVGGVREWTGTAALGRSRRFVVRGGSFKTGDATGQPLWTRELSLADTTAMDLGFRLVCELQL